MFLTHPLPALSPASSRRPADRRRHRNRPVRLSPSFPAVPKIKKHSIEDVRARASFEVLAGDYTALKKAGSSWKGLSPFAPEKTPSFYVHPDKGFFYCFSTAQGGDIFKFVMLKEGLGFQEAVERVATRFGIPLEYEEIDAGEAPVDRALPQQLLRLHDAATAFYAAAFQSSDAGGRFAREYWAGRRFTPETAREFCIGFAPVTGGTLARFLLDRGFEAETLAVCGLFFGMNHSPDPLRWRPRFRGRLMIPIRDTQGRVVAFTARKLDITPADDPAHDAKYVNSPETAVFHKSRILFNLDKAREAVREAERAKPAEPVPIILVEGQLDAIRAHTCGLRNTVAGQGTSVTIDHFRLLKRFASRVDLLLDADRAGTAAVVSKIPLAFKAGLDARVLTVPGGKDPDEFFADAAGDAARLAEAREAVLGTLTGAIPFAVRALIPPGVVCSEQRKGEVLQTLYGIAAEVESRVRQSEMVREISTLTVSDPIAVNRDFQRYVRMHRRRKESAAAMAKTAEAGAGVGGTATGGAHGASPVRNVAGAVPANEIPGLPEDAATGGGGVIDDPLAGGPPPPADFVVIRAAGEAPKSASPVLWRVEKPLNSAEETLLVLVLRHKGAAEALAPVLNSEWLDPASAAARLLNRALAEAHEGQWEGAATLREFLETPEEENVLARIEIEAAEPPPESEAAEEEGDGTASKPVPPPPPWWAREPARLASEALAAIVRRHTKAQLDRISAQLAALAPGNTERANALLREMRDLRQRSKNPPKIEF